MKEKNQKKHQVIKKLEELAKITLQNLHQGRLDEELLKEFNGSVTKFLAYVARQGKKEK